MGSKSGGAETNATSSPWGPSQSYLLDLMRQAQGMQQSGAPMTADANPWQAMGWQQQMQGAQGMYPMMQQGNAAWQQALGATDIANNPQLNAAHAASEQQMNQNLERNVLPALTAGSMSVGGLNNSRGQIAQGIAAGDTQTAIANSRANMNLGAYNSGLQAQSSAIGQMGNMMNNQLAPGNVYNQVGGQIQDQQNRQLMDPWNRLGWLGNLYGGMAGQGSQSTQEQPGGSMLGSAAGGAMAGAAIGGPWGALAGGALGALAS